MRTSYLLVVAAFSLLSANADAAQKKRKKVAPPPPPPPAAVVEEPAPPPPPPAPVVVAPKPAEKLPEPPPAEEEPKPISVAPLFGYATNHMNVGVGIRAGYTLSNRVYVGGTFVYHFGTSEDVPSLTGGTTTSSAHLLYPGGEVGYDIHAGPVIIRPYGGVGLALAIVSLGDKSDSKSSLALWPGVTVSYDIPRSPVFVGGDARLLIVTSGGDPSFGMFATGGMRF